jgi:carbon storage regulator CsrA
MLVLTRKIGQEIVIGGDIRIKVVAIDGGRVLIGIVAPEDVIVDRQEIHEKRPKWADNAICQPVAALTPSYICKKLDNLPPIVSEWQQSCKQPQCSHYCDGECRNSGRQSASAPCPFDGNELLLVDSEAVYSDDASPLKPYLATPTAAKKDKPRQPTNCEWN